MIETQPHVYFGFGLIRYQLGLRHAFLREIRAKRGSILSLIFHLKDLSLR